MVDLLNHRSSKHRGRTKIDKSETTVSPILKTNASTSKFTQFKFPFTIYRCIRYTHGTLLSHNLEITKCYFKTCFLITNPLWSSDALWWHGSWLTFGSDNGILTVGTKGNCTGNVYDTNHRNLLQTYTFILSPYRLRKGQRVYSSLIGLK